MGIVLDNGILRVVIKDIGEYEGVRFDWTGFVTDVELRSDSGLYSFCMPESMVPGQGTGGHGLCGEYGLFEAVGYADTEVGGWFPKFGVGLLRRDSAQPYQFFREYAVDPFALAVTSGSDWAEYVINDKLCGGYAAALRKRLELRDNALNISYTFMNTGSQRIQTHEYVHNFLGINERPIGPDYTLRFGCPVEWPGERVDPSGVLVVRDGEVRWSSVPEGEFYAVLKLDPRLTDEAPFFWELRHEPSGVSVRESGDFAPMRMALWGKEHVVSPEVFIRVDVEPGQSMQWTRTYTFIKHR